VQRLQSEVQRLQSEVQRLWACAWCGAGAHSGDGEVTAGDAIQQALEEGCTDKTRALAQAYRALLVAHHYTSPEALEWTWTQMEREGIIIRDGRQYRMQNGGAE
jgi:hypothetical protein